MEHDRVTKVAFYGDETRNRSSKQRPRKAGEINRGITMSVQRGTV